MKTILLGLTALMAFACGTALSASDARATTFTSGEFVSYAQSDWFGSAAASALLGAMSLFGWRRKQKGAAVIAAT